MQVASRMLMRLNIETRAEHPEADYPWLEMSLDASRSGYIDQLVATYGFEAPLEAAFELTPHLGEIVKFRQRCRSGLIVEDLLALGVTPSKIARLPPCKYIAPFRDQAQALGWMYVIERATLLHETVRTNIASRIQRLSAWCYLSAYQGVAPLRWQDFGRALDAYAITPAASDQIVASAREAFKCQRDWFASDPARFARDVWRTEISARYVVRE
jgi:heme oxygenase (biliverdin-IX-beta and delta-forming)